MTSKEDRINQVNPKGAPASNAAKTIDLQGVAAFVGLVELIAQELGTTPGRIQGLLPSGTSFEELVGEVTLLSQGFERTVTLYAKPGSPLKMIFRVKWRGSQVGLEAGEDGGYISGIEAHFFLDVPVETIGPQGRALARHVEDCFAVLDRMVTLGQSGKLSAMSISSAEIEAFEQSEAGNLVTNYAPRTGPVSE
jgi:hypothetical protein